jgi:hypothetical protein
MTATKQAATTEVVNRETGEVLQSTVRLDDETLREIGSFDDALKVMQDSGDIVVADAEIGNGFAVADDDVKMRLQKIPIALLSWTFNKGDYGKAEDGSDEFVTAHVVTKSGEKWIINDGSTGIRRQLRTYTNRTNRQNNMVVRNGLRFSEYVIDPETGKALPRGSKGDKAKTWYLDTSA